MYRIKIYRAFTGFIFTVIILSLTSLNVFADPIRLGSGFVSSIALSPDGTILAAWHNADTSTVEGELCLWDVRTQQQVSTSNLDGIRALAFSPDGTLLALGSTGITGNKIRLWDVAGQNQVGLMQSPTRWGVMSLAFSPDGKTLASSGDGSTLICLWDVQTQQQVGVLRGHTGRSVWSVAFSPDGKLLCSGGFPGDEAVRVWDVQTQRQVGALIGHSDVTMDLAFSPDGTILASAGGSNDMAVYLWDVETQNQVGVLGGHSAHVGSIAFSPNGKLLASTVYWDNTVHIWDIASQKELGLLKGHDATDLGWGDQVTISSDGKRLACGSENGVEFWELDQPKTMLTDLMLFIMNEFYEGTIDAELAWDLLVEVQTAIAALDSDNPNDAKAAMNDLKVLINQEVQTNNNITPGAAAKIIQRADEITIVVVLGS